MTQWHVPVPLIPDELLSSWLVRAALTYGCDPLVLTSQIWPKWRAWIVDIDRKLSENQIKLLSEVSGIPADELQSATLYSTARKINVNLHEKAIWPWILAIGARNTKRHGGLQYCPICFAEDSKPYYRTKWRYAWHTACKKHQCLLLDRCHACKSSLEPHRLLAEDECVNVCATCKANLTLATCNTLSFDDMAFQTMADAAILNGYGWFQNQKITVNEWFQLAGFFIPMFRCANRSHTVALDSFLSLVAISPPHDLPIISGAGIELLRTRERQKLFVGLCHFMTASKNQLKDAAIKSCISRQALCNRDQMVPSALMSLYETLPDHPKLRSKNIKRGKHAPRPRHEVMRMMAKLERELEMSLR